MLMRTKHRPSIGLLPIALAVLDRYICHKYFLRGSDLLDNYIEHRKFIADSQTISICTIVYALRSLIFQPTVSIKLHQIEL